MSGAQGGSDADSHAIVVTTAAQRRVTESVLDWGGQRPIADPGLAAALRSALEDGLEPLRAGLQRLARRQGHDTVTLPSSVRTRVVCDGWQLEPEPYSPGRSAARGLLARQALLSGFVTARLDPPRQVVDDVWRRLASRTPGDPSSVSAWLNQLDEARRAGVRDEIADLVATFREVWPQVPVAYVDVDVDRRIEVPLLDGLVRLQGRLDVALEGRRTDDRARGLVIELTTGMPRPAQDLAQRRSAALLRALTAARPPFRWATYHATDGRIEVEDLADGGLWSAVEQVVDVAAQLVRLEGLGPGARESSLRLSGGHWCAFCRRRATCSRSQVPDTPDGSGPSGAAMSHR